MHLPMLFESLLERLLILVRILGMKNALAVVSVEGVASTDIGMLAG
jgi:hypothetical protein